MAGWGQGKTVSHPPIITSPRRSLASLALRPLPLGSLRPRGWLHRQLRIQADGLGGHLHEFWPDVRDSGWVGGKAEGWERGPYWLDGFLPLAFLLDDPRLKKEAVRWMDYVLDHPQEDGWLGPQQAATHKKGPAYRSFDPWPPTVFLKAAIQFHEATGDARVPKVMGRFFRKLDRLLDTQMLFDWNRMRWQDLAWCVHWLYDRTGEPWLVDLAMRLARQGYDWVGMMRNFHLRERTETGRWSYEAHVVNNAMGIKQPGVTCRHTGRVGDGIEAARMMIATLDRYHGQATGVFTGDENLAGLNPSQGTELCAVVEYLFSLEVLLASLGEPSLADRLEKIAFNALPAAFSPDMWAHQYDQQANQVQCIISKKAVYTTNGPNSNLYGLEPNYGCCTANLHQGWPKFAAHLWMSLPDGGLAALSWAPCEIKTRIHGQAVRVKVETDYPFNEEIHIKVFAKRPVQFPLNLRIPEWTDGAEVTIGTGRTTRVKAGTFHRIIREWKGETTLTLHLPMKLKTSARFNGSVVIERGPLVYALKIGEEWKQVSGEKPHADWEVRPTTPWNYALQVDRRNPARSVTVESGPVGTCPFSPEGAPIRMRVKGRRLKSWKIERNAATPPPASPAESAAPIENLTLIPYGCTNLRVTEFPTLGVLRLSNRKQHG